MTKYTCWKDYDRKVEGAIEGTKEEVLAWMQERFLGLKLDCGEDEDRLIPAWEFFYEGEVTSYLTNEGGHRYLVELLEN